MPLHLSAVEHEVDLIVEDIYFTEPWKITITERKYERLFGPVQEKKLNQQLLTLLYPKGQQLWEDKIFADPRHHIFGRTRMGKPTPSSQALLTERIVERAKLEIDAIIKQLFMFDSTDPIFNTGKDLQIGSCLYHHPDQSSGNHKTNKINSLAHETDASERAINENL